MAASPLLRALATQQGIQTSYLDMAGRRRIASSETLRAILQLCDVPAQTPRQIREALQEHTLRHWRQLIDPVIVAWDGQPAKVELRLPADSVQRQIKCQLLLEDGRHQTIDCRPEFLPTRSRISVAGFNFHSKELILPEVPSGYHQLEFELGERISGSILISAPTRTYSPPEAPKTWGIFLPMYAAHSKNSWGAGNFTDWQNLGKWIDSFGGTVMSTLPVLAAFLDAPICEPSPYSPASRLFWNEFYLDIPATPEFARCAAAQKLVRSAAFVRRIDFFRREDYIDYVAQMALRREVLSRLAKFFFASDSSRRQVFDKFLQQRPSLTDYAEFRATCDRTGTSWRKWDERLRHGRLEPGDYSDSDKNYHLYVQWLAQEQISALARKAPLRSDQSGTSRRKPDSDFQFYLDLPLGVHPDGFDTWRNRDAFALPASTGAPPDVFFTRGQDWAFAPLHPRRIRESGYRYVIAYLRFQMRHAGMLRIDHVMGLHRLYWIPPGFPASEGAYVTYPAEELHAIISLESHRHQTVIVGENLGTVPPEVNRAMRRHGLRKMFVLQYEQRPNLKQPLHSPPAEAVASLNTHDMPLFAAHWRGLDLNDRAALGLIPQSELPRERARREKLNFALTRFLFRCMVAADMRRRKPERSQPLTSPLHIGGYAKDALHACLTWLFASPAETVLINLEDLWLETRPQNVPGTQKERPNWRRKARLTFEEIRNSNGLAKILRHLQEARATVIAADPAARARDNRQ